MGNGFQPTEEITCRVYYSQELVGVGRGRTTREKHMATRTPPTRGSQCACPRPWTRNKPNRGSVKGLLLP